jgi:cyanophycinase
VVQRDTLEVVGKSYVAIYDYNTIIGKGAGHVVKNSKGLDDEDFTASSGLFFFLSAGQKYDLKNRKVLPAEPRKRPATLPPTNITDAGATSGAGESADAADY